MTGDTFDGIMMKTACAVYMRLDIVGLGKIECASCYRPSCSLISSLKTDVRVFFSLALTINCYDTEYVLKLIFRLFATHFAPFPPSPSLLPILVIY